MIVFSFSSSIVSRCLEAQRESIILIDRLFFSLFGLRKAFLQIEVKVHLELTVTILSNSAFLWNIEKQ